MQRRLNYRSCCHRIQICLERQPHKVAVRLCAALKLTEKIKLLEVEVGTCPNGPSLVMPMNVNTLTVSQTVLYSRHVTCHRHLAYIRPTTAFSFVELAFNWRYSRLGTAARISQKRTFGIHAAGF